MAVIAVYLPLKHLESRLNLLLAVIVLFSRPLFFTGQCAFFAILCSPSLNRGTGDHGSEETMLNVGKKFKFTFF